MKKKSEVKEQKEEIEYAPYQWIGVMVALPPYGEEVVVTNALQGKALWMTCRHEGNDEITDSNGFISDKGIPEVTHWMRIDPVNLSTAYDIDWSKSVAEIDQMLYKKYGLTQEEIDFIEKTIKPME